MSDVSCTSHSEGTGPILLVQPPRLANLLETVRGSAAQRRFPCAELIALANRLRERGYRAELLDADVLEETEYLRQIESLGEECAFIAFFLRVYRIGGAKRAAMSLRQRTGPRPAVVAFGYISREFAASSAALPFDAVLLGPDWGRGLEHQLERRGVRRGAAVAWHSISQGSGCRRLVAKHELGRVLLLRQLRAGDDRDRRQ